ncbi:MAG: HPr family phosphocarrier protein [Chloroflexi bacterium]|nr:HPr family phosphocarrier protein [Chloroflexota bacterium]
MNLTLTILNPTGLHARPGAIFAATAKKFKSAIQIRNLTKDGDWSDAKSVLGVLKLGAENGHQIELSITGEDEAEAAQTLRRVVENGLGESVTGVALRRPAPRRLPPRHRNGETGYSLRRRAGRTRTA